MGGHKQKIVFSRSYRGDLSKAQMRRYADKWDGLPVPRLQLRWDVKPVPKCKLKRAFAPDDQAWDCFYELVLPVDKWDIRDERYETRFILVPIGHSRRHSSIPPCSNSALDDPYRDGAHAFMDSKTLGWLPIYVVAPDGTATRKLTYYGQPKEWVDLAAIAKARGGAA